MAVVRAPLLAAVALLGCTTAYVPPATVSPTKQDSIIARDLVWLNDTIPLLRFNTPYVYAVWRLQAEQCSGRTREGWPRFYVSPLSPIPTPLGLRLAFYAGGTSQAVVLGLGVLGEQRIVIHELLHWLHERDIPPAPLHETPEERESRLHPSGVFGDAAPCAPYIKSGG